MKSLFSFTLLLAVSAASLCASDLSITAGSIIPGLNAHTDTGIAGATITAGQLVYLETSSNTWKVADADASAATANVGGLALSAATSGQEFIYLFRDDNLTLGATMSMTHPGIYCLSSNAGAICPVADLSSGCYPVPLIVVKTTTTCIFNALALRGPSPLSLITPAESETLFALLPPAPRAADVYNRPRRNVRAPVV